MGKKLAIKGHVSRGKEVIELFKMMGGCECGYGGGGTGFYYYISQFGNIEASCKPTEFDTYIVYTLEEFWEKYPFKIGDKVIDTADGCPGVVSEMKWDEDVSDMKYFVVFGNGIDFGWYVNDSIEFCEENENLEETQLNQDIDKVVDIFRKEFCECCGSRGCSGQDDELVYCERFKNLMDNSGKPSGENHKMGPKSKLPSKYYEEMQPKRDIDKSDFIIKHMILPNKMDDKLEYEIIDGYEFDKVENNKIILKPIKSKYPTTYVECCKIKHCDTDFYVDTHFYSDALGLLYKLLICRNAYWKIAGEQMGLGKPWEPAIQDTIWGITRSKDEVEKYSCHYGKTNLLEFPTEEMRNVFYENFKDLIEQCKELL